MKAIMARDEQAPADRIEEDPHASKISPDDPRLSIPRPRSRVLKMTPIIAAAAVLIGLGAFTILSSMRKPDKRVAVTQEAAKVPERPPGVPAFLQQVPDSPVPPPKAKAKNRLVKAHRVPTHAFADLTPAAPSDPRFEREGQLAEEARSSSLFFGSAAGSTRSVPPTIGVAPSASALMAGVPGATVPATTASDTWDPNLQLRKNAFLDAPKGHPDYVAASLQTPLSPYELKATAIIPATLITGINSDLPGPIIAQVREPVYDTVTGQHLLIPQGARLLANYDSMIAWGQERVLLCWQRIIFPNGSSINLDCMPAADLKGQAGLTDEVDQHWDRLLAAVGLSTVLSLGVQAAAGNPTGYQPSLAQSAARNASQEFNSIGQGVVQRQLNIQPTITVRPGFGVNVIVTKDLVLQPYVD